MTAFTRIAHHPAGGIQIDKAGCADMMRWSQPRVPLMAWRFFWNPRPGAELCLNDRVLALDGRSAALVAPGVTVTGRLRDDAARPVRHLFVHFRLMVEGGIFPAPLIRVPIDRGLRARLAALAEPTDGRADPRFGGTLRVMAALAEALGRVGPGDWQVVGGDARVVAAMATIRRDYRKPLRVQTLAEAAHLAPESFIRLFTREVGVSPYQYLRGYRLQMSEGLLRRSQMSIEQVARASGFAERSSYCRAFQQYFRQTPAAYRRMHLHVHEGEGEA